MSIIVISLSLLYQDKDGAVWCMMFIECRMVVVMWDQNTWNTIPVSE
jgi:hypothetical protein